MFNLKKGEGKEVSVVDQILKDTKLTVRKREFNRVMITDKEVFDLYLALHTGRISGPMIYEFLKDRGYRGQRTNVYIWLGAQFGKLLKSGKAHIVFDA